MHKTTNMAACDNIDWSTFTFVAATGQTLVSASELTGTNGTAVFNEATRKIEYTVGAGPSCPAELIQFKVEDTEGRVSNIATWVIDYENTTAPTATGGSVTLAAGAIDTFDALAVDTGDIEISSYLISTNATKAVITNNLDGTFTVIAPEDQEGADSFDYTVDNTNGITSSAGTVNLTIQNAGTGTSATICPVAGVDLTSYLTGSVTAGGSWSADASNPSSPSIATPTSVDFSAANAGTYLFTYTIGSSAATITLELLDYSVTINSVSTPTSNPIAGSTTSVIEFTTIGVTNANNIEIEVDVKGGTSFDYYPPDTWNADTGEGTVIIEYADGVGTYDITVTATDSCGTSQTDTWPTITIVA